MGAAASLQDNVHLSVSVEDRTLQLYPAYMILDAVVNEVDLEQAKISWKQVVDDESPEYLRLKHTEGFDKASCLTWFFDQFYIISDVLDSNSSSLYGDSMKIQIRALIGMINSTLSMFKGQDLERVSTVLLSIAKGHAKRGVRAYQYPIVGEIFMLTMKHCLGESYDDKVELAWKKLFSVMLKFVLPAAIREERLLHKVAENIENENGEISNHINDVAKADFVRQLSKEPLPHPHPHPHHSKSTILVSETCPNKLEVTAEEKSCDMDSLTRVLSGSKIIPTTQCSTPSTILFSSPIDVLSNIIEEPMVILTSSNSFTTKQSFSGDVSHAVPPPAIADAVLTAVSCKDMVGLSTDITTLPTPTPATPRM